MKTKLIKTISSCTTLVQLISASKYILLYAVQHGRNEIYEECMFHLRDKLSSLSGANMRNFIDYKAYAQHLLCNGMINEANEFLAFAELELHKLEEFVNKVENEKRN